MTDKGTCKHGEFNLEEGCPQCLAERRAAGIRPEEDEMEDGLNAEGRTLVGAETALALRPGEDVEARGYFQEALKLLAWAQGRVIATLEDNKAATDDLSIIAKLKKAMEGKRKEYLEPLKAQTEAIRETYNYLMTPVLEADKITRDQMLAYTREQEDKRREEERINALRLEAAQAEMELKGELTEPVNLVEVSPEAPKRVSTDMGTAGQRENWKWEVIDFSIVPDEYKIINAGMLTPVVKASKGKITIPGVRVYNEPIIAVNVR